MARYLGMFFQDLGQATRQLYDFLMSLFTSGIAFLLDFWKNLGRGVKFSENVVEWHAYVSSNFMAQKIGTIYGYLVFFALTYACFEMLRWLNDVIFRNNNWWRLVVNEALGACQMCVCAYAEAAIWTHYGLIPFFIVTGISFTISTKINRGAADKTALLMEETFARNAEIDDFRYVISSQLLGAACAFFFSHCIWLCTWKITGANLDVHTCLLVYDHPYVFVCFYEFISSFVFRLVLTQFDDPSLPQRQKFVPWLYATFFTVGFLITGSRGVHLPMNASRITGCTLTDTVEIGKFILCFIFIPLTGSFAASRVPDRPTTMRSFWRLQLEERQRLAAEEAAEKTQQNRGRGKKGRKND